MLKTVRQVTFGIIIGLLIGLWFGVNLGKNKPIYSNPFAEEDIQQKAKRKAEEVIKDTKEAIREKLE
jgi:Na+/glutamate symporter